MEHQLFHKRHLPHLHPSEGIFFITYRLADSMPKEIINALQQEYKNEKEDLLIQPNKHSYFVAFDEYLDKYQSDKNYLSIPKIAEINKNAIHHFDSKYYQLICYCIMSNHIHLVIKLIEDAPDLSQTMHSIKRFTAKESNVVLNKSGKFWMQESYDHLVRTNAELRNIVNYVINNPVKAGLTDKWDDWPHTYVRMDFLD
ncbi:transposase [soil metagenome]